MSLISALSATSLLVIILSEYGLQARKQAANRWLHPWAWWRSLARVGFWALLWLFSGASRSRGWTIGILEAAAVTEATCFILRRGIRSEAAAGRPYGRPWFHLLPWAASVVLTILATVSGNWLREPLAGSLDGMALTLLVNALAVTLLWTWGTFFTVSIIELVRPAGLPDDPQDGLGAGEVIGILERLLVYTLVLAGSLASAGFIVAFKSAARFPQFKQPDFAEYFLIGTLSSVGLATAVGLAAHLI